VNEAETRAEHIDPALAAAGWGVVEGSRIRREYLIAPGRIEGHGRRGKALTADYVLEYRNTKLAVIEAEELACTIVARQRGAARHQEARAKCCGNSVFQDHHRPLGNQPKSETTATM
jgi:type I site-specific restriction endonuclease